MGKEQLLERYEARGDERDFRAATRLYEQALDQRPTAQALLEYGYLQECQVLASLGDADESIGRYRELVESRPDKVRWYRFLVSAYLAAGKAEEARAAIDAGLSRAADDRLLIVLRGETKAAAGDVQGALGDWRRALELGSDDISPLYSTAFLLEREGRLPGALDAWQAIVDWCEEHGAEFAAEYPRRELERVRRDVVAI
jgi:tetratricopeptide (TPR) repeat protein